MVSGTKEIDTNFVDELVKLYEAEKFWTYIGQAYTGAALLYSLMRHERETKVYANKAAEAMELEFGNHNWDTQAMKLLSEDMTAHWSWDAMRKTEGARQGAAEAGWFWSRRRERRLLGRRRILRRRM